MTAWSTADTDVDLVDQLLAGWLPDGDEDLAPVAALFGSLRARAESEPRPPVGDELAAVLWPDPVVFPDRPRALRRALRTRRQVVAARLAIMLGAFLGTGGLATAGALPTSVQHTAANIASAVGLDLPDGNQLPPVESSAVSQPGTSSTTEVAAYLGIEVSEDPAGTTRPRTSRSPAAAPVEDPDGETSPGVSEPSGGSDTSEIRSDAPGPTATQPDAGPV
ncbi:MAG: hypothetical protein ACRD0U_17540, partial [Acidimicrobiales bacterium]